MLYQSGWQDSNFVPFMDLRNIMLKWLPASLFWIVKMNFYCNNNFTYCGCNFYVSNSWLYVDIQMRSICNIVIREHNLCAVCALIVFLSTVYGTTYCQTVSVSFCTMSKVRFINQINHNYPYYFNFFMFFIWTQYFSDICNTKL